MIPTGLSFTRRIFGSAVFVFFFCFTGLRASEPFTFCSYNVKNWLKMERFEGGKKEELTTKPAQEKAKVIEYLVDIHPDVLGLCEIGTQEDLSEIQAALKAKGIDLPHSELTRAGDDTRSLGLLSKFPIKARNSQTKLTYRIGTETFPFQRGILDVTVDVAPDFEVRFMGVHLKSKRVVAEADEALMRRNEAHLLRLHLDSIFSKYPQTKILCYGDFNEHRHEASIHEIIGSRESDGLMIDLHMRDEHGLVWTHFWDAADSYSRLDYLFLSRALRPYVDPKNTFIYSQPDFMKASDHRPLVLRMNTSFTRKVKSEE